MYERFELALAEYYEDVTDAVDAASPFPILEKHGAWGLVDIKNVLRQVQVLPDFVYGTRFILNTHTIYEIIVFWNWFALCTFNYSIHAWYHFIGLDAY